MKYRRLYLKGGTYFFTLVTYQRFPVFSSPDAIELLNDAFEYTALRMPFSVIAFVILPDHMHYIWTLPEDSADYSTRWRLIKSHFTRARPGNLNFLETDSRKNKKERNVWQRRFWEHLIRNDDDLTRHLEYIHFNPVKHGYVNSPKDWQYTSFAKYVADGLYPDGWGKNGYSWDGYTYMETDGDM